MTPVQEIRKGLKSRRKNYKRGLAAGTLVFTGEKKVETPHISLIDFSKEAVTELKLTSIRDAVPFATKDSITWINIDGIHDENLIREVGEHFKVHPLVLEDILNPSQRPKLEQFSDYMYIVMKMVQCTHEHDGMELEQLSILFTSKYIITFQERPGDAFEGIRNRIRQPDSRVRNNGIDFLLYALIDAVVDEYFSVLEYIGDKIEEVEDKIIRSYSQEHLVQLQGLKRNLVFIRKYTWPTRELVNNLQRTENPLIHPETRVFFYDVYDHILRIIETVESFRDLTNGVQDLNLSLLII